MSTSTTADAAHTSDNSQPAAPSTTSSQRPPNQPGLSRFSPNTSSLATSIAGDGSVDSTAATHGSATTRGSATSTDSVGAARERTLSALEHGGQPAPESDRNAEALISAMNESPGTAQQMSSSGSNAREKRQRYRDKDKDSRQDS